MEGRGSATFPPDEMLCRLITGGSMVFAPFLASMARKHFCCPIVPFVASKGLLTARARAM